MDDLRRIVKYPFSIKISGDVKLNSINGYLKRLLNGEIQIFSTQEEIFEMASDLLERGIKFTVQEVSLNNIFEFLVEGGVED